MSENSKRETGDRRQETGKKMAGKVEGIRDYYSFRF